MLRLLLPILLTALAPGDDGWKPTNAELQRADEMLAGSWQFVSIDDKGEKLGPKLVETRFARDGILKIADRRMTIVNPVTGEQRTATYRIDPSKTPRRIDLFTRDDRILRGIYKFENDNLIICLQPGEAKDLPQEFASPAGSDLILVRLKALSASSAATPRPVSNPGNSRPTPTVRDRGPSEGELRRARRAAIRRVGHPRDDRRRRGPCSGPDSCEVCPERQGPDRHPRRCHCLTEERRATALGDPTRPIEGPFGSRRDDAVRRGIERNLSV